MGPFNQAETNVVAHGMSSLEESKFRYWDADPELLQDPYDVAQAAEAKRAAEEARREVVRREERSRGYADREMGYISLVGVEMFDV